MNESIKNWLIRTKQKQILGPISKAKVLELLDKGSLAPEDELTSGNGYWFLVKETELMDKYINGDVPQGFNPISEAPTVIATAEKSENTMSITPRVKKEVEEELSKKIPSHNDLEYPETSSDEETEAIPSSDDLEYPDMASPSVSISEDPAPENLEAAVPKSDDLEYPDMASPSVNVSEDPAPENLEAAVPKSDDLEYPDLASMAPSASISIERELVHTNLSKEVPHSEGVTAREENSSNDEDASIEGKMPSDEDLEYPGLDDSRPSSEIDKEDSSEALTFELNLEGSHKESPPSNEINLEEPQVKIEEVLPEKKVAPTPKPKERPSRKAKPAASNRTRRKRATERTQKIKIRRKVEAPRQGGDRYLLVVLIFLIMVMIGTFYVYKKVLNKPLPLVGSVISSLLIEPAQAAYAQNIGKKKA